MDVSFQFWLPEDRLLQLWSDYKFTYLSSFRKAAQSSLRDVAAGESGGRRGQVPLPCVWRTHNAWNTCTAYHAEEFFHNRTVIEAAMKDKLSEEIARRHGQVVSVQVRAVVLFFTVVP